MLVGKRKIEERTTPGEIETTPSINPSKGL